MEKELDNFGNRDNITQEKTDGERKKGQLQKEKKRKKEVEETEEDNDPTVEDGEKVFLRSKTSRAHYHEILKEMEYIKGMPSVMLLPMLVDRVLSCEIKRQKSRNINGKVTRLMRENLIKIYCAIGELRSQKESVESGKLKKQLDEMKKNMDEIQEKNKNLRKELEEIKRSINMKEIEAPTPISMRKEGSSGNKKVENLSGRNRKENSGNTQLVTASLEKKAKTPASRRKLIYVSNFRRFKETEERERINNTRTKKDGINKKKRLNSINSIGKGSTKKRNEIESQVGKYNDAPEMWSRVVGRKEKAQNKRRNGKEENQRNREKAKVKMKKPFKTSAVVITTSDRSTSYSEVLA